MRQLMFNVNSQCITRDPECDFSGLVAGTVGYLQACFSFSPEWDGCKLVAQFWRGEEEHARFIIDGTCDIPPDVLLGRTFKVSVIGVRDGYRISTNKVVVRQEVCI